MDWHEDWEQIFEEAAERERDTPLSDSEFGRILDRALRDSGFEEADLARDIFTLQRTLRRETDRGCALTAGAYLDEMLQRLLERYFRDERSVVEQFFAASGVLSSFSAKIDMSFALGLLDDHTRAALHLVRRIRNEFAHISSGLSFREERIASRCRSLNNERALSPRQRFVRATLALVGAIYANLKTVKRCTLVEMLSAAPEVHDRLRRLRASIERQVSEHYVEEVIRMREEREF